MILYEMTATFGKLDHQTLTLKPGMNIIQAPNEWGKSTWCAFLVSMLYGMETRAKTTKTVLAEKEKYAPWSGSPMEGRIDLNWNGRDITIERRTKGRTPFGVFRAYETATGVEIPELTASNCGQTLLGVERSVFTRAGFLRLSDLPVTQDEALRRRLNALVTTGDESGGGDALAEKLRDLKNRCRYNRSGLLPQAEAELAELEQKQQELEERKRQLELSRCRQFEVEAYLDQLNNHITALNFSAAQADAARVQAASAEQKAAAARLEKLEDICRKLPPRETAEQNVRSSQSLQQQWISAQMESQMLWQVPQPPEAPQGIQNVPVEQAVAKARVDGERYLALLRSAGGGTWRLWLRIVSGLIGGGMLALYTLHTSMALVALGGVLLIAAVVTQVLQDRRSRRCQAEAQTIREAYGSSQPVEWISVAEGYVNSIEAHRKTVAHYRALRGDLDQRLAQIQADIDRLTGGQALQDYIQRWQQVLAAWDQFAAAHREHCLAESHVQQLRAMAKTAEAPAHPDELTFTEAQTLRMLSDYGVQLRQLQLQIGQCQGRMTALGDEECLQKQIAVLKQRIVRLEETYEALDLALRTLSNAATELQRRFAPRIAARAQELFGELTDGRYNRLSLTQELAVNAGAEGENTLRSAQWRSEGTVDQLYLALRLAVAEELTPQAPLILDDALVRFDDHRLEKAMEILSREAEIKQVLLFTCQQREALRQPETGAESEPAV